jgi:hypothetical protein
VQLEEGEELEDKAVAKTVAVFNSNEDVIEMLRQALESAGFNTSNVVKRTSSRS